MANVSYKMVKFEEIFWDYARNFRMAESYGECEPIAGFNPEKQKPNLYEDIKLNGLNTPLALVELSPEESDLLSARTGRRIRYRGVRGHRRGRSIENIRKDNPHMLETVPANVYKGLSASDEFRLMADHVHVKGLNEYELFDAVCKLAMNTNLSEEAIGHQLGRSRGYVQRRKWIMNLPPIVEENFRKKFLRGDDGKPVPHTPFTDPDLTKLYGAAGEDRRNGVDPASPGSKFSAAWETLEKTGKAAPAEPKAWTRKEMLEKLNWIKDPIIRNVLQACAGEGVRLTDSVEQIDALRARIKDLESGQSDAESDVGTGTNG